MSRVRLGFLRVPIQHQGPDRAGTYDRPRRTTSSYRNRGEARIRGLELEVPEHMRMARLARTRRARWTRGVALDDDAALDDMPPSDLYAGPAEAADLQGVRVSFEARSSTSTPGPARPRPACRATPWWTRQPAPRWRSGGTQSERPQHAPIETTPGGTDPRAVPAPGRQRGYSRRTCASERRNIADPRVIARGSPASRSP